MSDECLSKKNGRAVRRGYVDLSHHDGYLIHPKCQYIPRCQSTWKHEVPAEPGGGRLCLFSGGSEPHLPAPQAVRPMVGATTRKLFPGSMGSLCQASYAPLLLYFLPVQPALAGGHLLSSPLQPPGSLSSSPPRPVCLGWLLLLSSQPISVPPLVASAISVPRARWSSPLFSSHPCPPLPRGHASLPLPAHSTGPLILPVGPPHVFPTCRRTLSIHLSFSVPLPWAQPE